jgi:hypothetical protein
VGRDQPNFPAGRAQRRDSDDSDGFRFLHGRGARPEASAAPLAGSGGQAGHARPQVVRQHLDDQGVHHHRSRAGVLPGGPSPGRASPRLGPHRPHAVRRSVAQGPGAGGSVLRLHPSASWRS